MAIRFFMNKKNWWLLPATIIGYLVYKKYVLAKTISVFFKSIDFSNMSLLYPTINIVVQINNPTDITAQVQNIKGDLYLNNIYVGNVIGITPTTLVTGSSTLRIPVTLSYTGVASLIKGLKTGGINLRFTGSIMVDLITLPLNFEYNI
jgi:LEA14-like dessication related protein